MKGQRILMVAGLIIALFLAFTTAGFAESKSTLTISQRGFNSWDPALEMARGTQTLLLIYEPLLLYKNRNFIPRLATSWEKSADAKVWTFKLRKGVKFHNGEPFNAEAVKFSYNRVLRINKGPAQYFASFEEIKVLDDYTVQFVCKYPVPLDTVLAGPFGTGIVAPKLTAEKGDEWISQGNGCGTGPYKLVKWEKDVQIVLEKFDDYWQGWKPNQYEKVILKWVKEPSTRAMLLKGGELDIDDQGFEIDVLTGLKKQPELEVINTGIWQNLEFLLHTQKAPTDDLNVRKAICYAINYDELVKYIFGDTASKNLTPIPRRMYDHDPSLRTYYYDPQKAEALLKKSKYADQLAKGKLKLTIDDPLPEFHSVVLYLQAALQKVGLDVEIDTTPWPMIFNKLIKKDTAPNMAVMHWGSQQDTAWERFIDMNKTKKEGENIFNWSYYSNPEFDKLLDQARLLEGVDREKAKESYSRLQQMLLDDATSLLICDTNRVAVLNKSVKGYETNPAYHSVIWAYELYHE